MTLDEFAAQAKVKAKKHRQDFVEKKIEISGNEQDMEALLHTLRETHRMFNIDLHVKDKDLPARLTIGKEVEPEPVMYPRTSAYLRKFINALQDVKDAGGGRGGDVWVGDTKILATRGSRGEDITGVMENITWGSHDNRGGLSRKSKTEHLNVANALDIMVRNPRFSKKANLKGMLQTLNPEWVYIATLDTHHGAFLSDKQKKSIKGMLMMDAQKKDYPPDFGKDYTQAYVAMMRTDALLSMNTPTNITQNDWNTFLIDYGLTKETLHQMYRRPPASLGELLNFLFAYTVGKTMMMEGALVVPFAENRYPIENEVIYGTGEKAETGDYVEIKGYKYLHKAVVVGKGEFRVEKFVGEGKDKAPNVGMLSLDNIPGFTM